MSYYNGDFTVTGLERELERDWDRQRGIFRPIGRLHIPRVAPTKGDFDQRYADQYRKLSRGS